MKYVLTFLMIIPFAIYGDDFSTKRNLSLSAEGIEQLDINCGNGFLNLTGKPGLESIRVEAEIISRHGSTEKVKKLVEDYLELSLEKHGSKAELISKFESMRSFFSGYGDIQINLTVEIPEKMNLDIHDGSGSATIANVIGELRLDDGSGETTIENITGNIDVDDGSGSLSIYKIDGNVDIDDGSGGIHIREVTGNVEIEDGSGSIDVADVGGDVDVDDGSGSITIRKVGKDVIIRESGSGSVSISDVKGKIYRHDED